MAEVRGGLQVSLSRRIGLIWKEDESVELWVHHVPSLMFQVSG